MAEETFADLRKGSELGGVRATILARAGGGCAADLTRGNLRSEEWVAPLTKK